jgi:hypothetical protein
MNVGVVCETNIAAYTASKAFEAAAAADPACATSAISAHVIGSSDRAIARSHRACPQTK